MKKFLIIFLSFCLPLPSLCDEFFEKNVRPVLVENCYECHSTKAEKVKGNLRLDVKEELEALIDTKTPGNSKLIQVIAAGDMPPKKKMSSADAGKLFSWIRMGAKMPDAMVVVNDQNKYGKALEHWAYEPIIKPELPDFSMEGPLNPIDAFILNSLEEKGLTFSPEADKRSLIRRAYYDLIGLPPSTQEVQDFISGKDSWESIIDRLLASPHYGERWGRYWLDVARYSDYKGGFNVRRDDPRFTYAWTYRDYVIRAFNEDLPYDEFIRNQLAADLQGHKDWKLAALGFLTVGKKDRDVNNVIDDQIDVTTKGFLGLTVVCARCHDHKFNPVTQEDYYALHGIFRSTTEPDDYNKPPIKNTSDLKIFEDYAKKRTAALKEIQEYQENSFQTWLEHFRAGAGEYIKHTHNYYYEIDPQSRGQYARTNSVLGDVQLVGFELGRWNAEFRKDNPFWNPYRELDNPQQFAAKFQKMEADNKKYHPSVVASLKALKPTTREQVVSWYANLFTKAYEDLKNGRDKNPKYNSSNTLYRFAVSVLFEKGGPCDIGDVNNFYRILNNTERTRYENGLRTRYAKIVNLEWTHDAAPPRAMVLQDSRVVNSRVFIKGNPRTLGDNVPRRFIEFLQITPQDTKYPDNTSGRLQLAESIISTPIAKRVIINRIWQGHFGTGFVETPDDLGNPNNIPVHQDLINYLSVYLVENGWSLKELHKLIMTSRTYKQSSKEDPKSEKIDIGNKLFHRQNIQRLDFEVLRDTLIFVSRTLDKKMGGGPVGLFSNISNRRSIYVVIDRQNVPELLINFDFADPNMPNGKRFVTTIPQQSLFLMNNPFLINLTKKVIENNKLSPKNITQVYNVIFQRNPSITEVRLGQKYLEENSFENYIQALLMSNELIYIN